MKHLNNILESIFDIEDNTDHAVIDSIHKFIKDNYKFKSYTIRDELVDGKYVVDAIRNVTVKNKHITTLTNDLFIWGRIDGYFDCGFCKSLTSLDGAPEKVGGTFDCDECISLISLKGAPKEVGGCFYCSWCKSLTSLEGAPKEVGSSFVCGDCKHLKTLEGAPKKVGGNFGCSGCNSLTSFKGAPEEVGGNFCCNGCTSVKDKTIDSKVKGKIFYY